MNEPMNRRAILQATALAPVLAGAAYGASHAATGADPLVVIADLVAKPGSEDALRALMAQVPAASRKEPGCLYYVLLEDRAAPGHFTTYETWASRADLDAHMTSSGAKAMLPHLIDLVGKPPTQAFLKILDEA